MKRWGVLLTLLVLAIAGYWLLKISIQPEAAITGVVYADVNGNGVQDEGEAGVADVAISNGRDVVLSGPNGRYRLPARTSHIVFIIKPAGYRLPLDALAKPRFYHYIDQADGEGQALSGAYNFGLYPQQTPSDSFSILVFADPQPHNEQQVGYYELDIIDDVENPGDYRFGLTLGDIVGNKPELLEPVARTTARLNIPWWYVIGNHDLDPQATDRYSARTPYTNTFGPTYYAFNEGRVHFIVLDDIAWLGPKANNYVGGLNKAQLDFIEADLRHVPKDRLVVLAMHIPPLGEWAFKGAFRLKDRERLFGLLAGREILTLAGHVHGQWRVDLNEGYGWHHEQPHHLYIVGATAGDMWSGKLDENGIPDATMREGTPNGYAMVHFQGNRYRLEWKAAGYPADYRMRIHGPAVLSDSDSEFFYVNYFMGYYSLDHVATPVEYREPGGQWRPMMPSFEADPYRIALGYPWLEAHWSDSEPPSGKQPDSAVPSLHLWKAKIPTGDEPGEKVLEIRITATDGRQYFGKFRYKIIPES